MRREGGEDEILISIDWIFENGDAKCVPIRTPRIRIESYKKSLNKLLYTM